MQILTCATLQSAKRAPRNRENESRKGQPALQKNFTSFVFFYSHVTRAKIVHTRKLVYKKTFHKLNIFFFFFAFYKK